MKRNYFLMISLALLVAATSCSKNDDNVIPDTVPILPVTYYAPHGGNHGGPITSTSSYNGTQLISIQTSDSTLLTPTYSNGLLTSMTTASVTKVISIETFTYSNGKLSIHTEDWQHADKSITVTKFTYNTDGTVTAISGNAISSDPTNVTWDSVFHTVYTLNSDGDVIKYVRYSTAGNTATFIFEHDTHPSPEMNVAGMKELAIIYPEDGMFHNVTKGTETYSQGKTYVTTYTITYDSVTGYPLKIEDTNGNSGTYTYNQ